MNKHQQVQDRLFEIEERVRMLEIDSQLIAYGMPFLPKYYSLKEVIQLILRHLGLRLVYTAPFCSWKHTMNKPAQSRAKKPHLFIQIRITYRYRFQYSPWLLSHL